MNNIRDLSKPFQRDSIKDLLQSIFVSELIKPSKELWIASAWISDIYIIDNQAKQFSMLYHEIPTGHVRLSKVLDILLELGTEVNIVLRKTKENFDFEMIFSSLKTKYPGKANLVSVPDFHEKCILGDNFLISGSMNLTFRGITINDEHVSYRYDRKSINEKKISLEQSWRKNFNANR